jgi:diguanylate cyclase (GGDEF)-like protein/PAS domain S-box-containing protein
MLREAPERLARIIDLLVDAVCAVDREGRFVYISGSGAQVFGREPVSMLGRPMLEFIHPDDRERTLAVAAQVMDGDPVRNFHNRYLRADGSAVDLLWSARWLPDEGLRIAVARDVSELKRSERRQAALYAIAEACQSEEEPQALIERLQDLLQPALPLRSISLVLAEPDGRHLQRVRSDAPPARVELLREPRAAEVLLGQCPLQLAASDGSRRWLGLPLDAALGIRGLLEVELAGDAPDTADSELLRYLVRQLGQSLRRRGDRDHLQHLARHDSLTDLPNRSAMHAHLQDALSAAAHGGHALAVLYLDLDGFKPVNDHLGHAVGDALLRGFGQRLRACLRPQDFVSRVGGDEFVVVLSPIAGIAQAERVAADLSQRLCEPLECGPHLLPAVPSVGLALYPDHGTTAEELLQAADAAMYRAKAEGGGGFRCAGAASG